MGTPLPRGVEIPLAVSGKLAKLKRGNAPGSVDIALGAVVSLAPLLLLAAALAKLAEAPRDIRGVGTCDNDGLTSTACPSLKKRMSFSSCLRVFSQ